jgi:hypothetical protein
VQVSPLSPGPHSFDLVGKVSGTIKFALNGLSVSVVAGQDTPASPNLLPAASTTASADVNWTFASGQNCSQVGVDHIFVVFDPASDGSAGRVVADTPCAGMGGAPVSEIVIVDVPDGSHSFAVRGTHQSNLTYYTHHPQPTLFQKPFTTKVTVTAESIP